MKKEKIYVALWRAGATTCFMSVINGVIYLLIGGEGTHGERLRVFVIISKLLRSILC